MPFPRSPEAGVTLIEMLVVLVMISVVAGGAALSVSTADRRSDLQEAAELLARRLQIAADSALLTGQDSALVWEDRRYGFFLRQTEGWVPHPGPGLGTIADLPSGLNFATQPGRALIAADLRPPSGSALTLRLASPRAEVAVLYDGAVARIQDALQ